MSATITVIDYGLGNLYSVGRAFDRLGASTAFASTVEQVMAAERILLPGVGAFANGMQNLARLGLIPALRDFAQSGRPLLGICLGMQLLFDASEEFGLSEGLGLIPGRVVAIPDRDAEGRRIKIPHIGWSELRCPSAREGWAGTLLQDIAPGTSMYFVHSFAASPHHEQHRVADCLHGGHRVSAAVQRDRIFGCQFHPEKSGEEGIRILKAFLEVPC